MSLCQADRRNPSCFDDGLPDEEDDVEVEDEELRRISKKTRRKNVDVQTELTFAGQHSLSSSPSGLPSHLQASRPGLAGWP